MSNTTVELYTTCTYLEKNPLWHTEESCWKAEQVLRMINRHKIVPRTICEVGCGAGEVLKQLQQRLDKEDYALEDLVPRYHWCPHPTLSLRGRGPAFDPS